MMNTEERRSAMIGLLQKETRPVSATTLAKKFEVSRQSVVGDIALLRASGYPILSTARGYILEKEESGICEVLFCKHPIEDTEKELKLIIDYGGEVRNTMIDHPVYGTITAELKLKDRYEIEEFMRKQKEYNGAYMSQITNGYHAHMIHCRSYEVLDRIKKVLKEEGILIEDNTIH